MTDEREWTDRARQLAAADLCERAAVMLRSLDPAAPRDDGFAAADVFRGALTLLQSPDPDLHYRTGLMLAGLSSADQDAAIAHALAGTTPHPLAPFLARVEAYGSKAAREALAVPGSYRQHRCEGEAHACAAIAGWLREMMGPAAPDPALDDAAGGPTT